MGLVPKPQFLSLTASGWLQGWAGLVQMLGAFDAQLVWIAMGPLGSASGAEGQAFFWKIRSQQAS